jgi:hypothetical protein
VNEGPRYELYGVSSQARAFLAGLPPAERDELLALEVAWLEIEGGPQVARRAHRGVVEDWIEERGGRRGVWRAIHAMKVREDDNVET